jgi:hypothetical protein
MDSLEARVEALERKVKAQGVLLEFFIEAAPHFSLVYYPTSKVEGAKFAQNFVEGVLVAEGMVGGKMVGRSFKSDLAEAVAQAEGILNAS